MNIAIPQPDYAAIKVKQKATWGAGTMPSSARRCRLSESA